MSMAMPGWRSTVGSMPRARAAARCGRKLSSPKRSGTAAGGEQMHGVGAAIVVRGHDGEGRRRPVRGEDGRDLGRRDRGDVAGQGQHRRSALARQQPRRGGDRAGMPVARAVLVRPWRRSARASVDRDRLERDHQDAGETLAPPPARPARPPPSQPPGRGAARASAAAPRRCLAPAISLTGTTAQASAGGIARRSHRRPPAPPAPAPRDRPAWSSPSR